MCFVYAHRTYPCIIIHEQGKNIKKTKQKNWFDMCDAPMSVLQYLFKLYCLRIHFFSRCAHVHKCWTFLQCYACLRNVASADTTHIRRSSVDEFLIYFLFSASQCLARDWWKFIASNEGTIWSHVNVKFIAWYYEYFWIHFEPISSSSSVSLEKMKIKYFSKIDLASIFAQKNK